MLKIFLLLVSAVGYGVLLYFTSRQNAIATLGLGAGLFGLFFALLWSYRDSVQVTGALWAGFAFRMLAWFAFPQLSDDCFRFFWDGKLWLAGVDPFSVTPAALAQAGRLESLGLSQDLFDKLNSPEYFTVYPPVLQAIFAFSAWLSPDSVSGAVVGMKGWILLSEAAILFLLPQMLSQAGAPGNRALWYALNPLVIVEFCGNAHFESLMLLGILLAWQAWTRQQYGRGGLAWAFAICVKLIPVVFSVVLIRRMPPIRLLKAGTVGAVCTVFCFLVMTNLEGLAHMRESLQLYYRHFEYNASVWYLIRALTPQYYGGDWVATIGQGLALSAACAIAGYAIAEPRPTWSNFPRAVSDTYFVYLLLSQTIHPWYIAPFALWGAFTGDRFTLAWTFCALFTYLTYRVTPYQESMALVVGEYAVVFAFWAWDRFFSKKALSQN